MSFRCKTFYADFKCLECAYKFKLSLNVRRKCSNCGSENVKPLSAIRKETASNELLEKTKKQLSEFDELFIKKCKANGFTSEQTKRELLSNQTRISIVEAYAKILVNSIEIAISFPED